MSFRMFERTYLLPHTVGHYIPTFAQLPNLCAKINAVAFNPAHTWTIWPTTNNPPPTPLHTTLLTINTSILSPNISSEGLQTFAQLSTVWQEFSSRNTDASWAKNKKNNGERGKNRQKKLSSKPNHPSLAYNIPLRLLFRSPPPNPPNFTLCAQKQRCTTHQDNNHSKQGRQRPKRRRKKFFFSSNQPFFRSFSL